jgi:hypothetical protein
MKKMKKQLKIEKTTISKLINLKIIQGGETIDTTDTQNIISRWPLCPPPPTLTTMNNC